MKLVPKKEMTLLEFFDLLAFSWLGSRGMDALKTQAKMTKGEFTDAEKEAMK